MAWFFPENCEIKDDLDLNTNLDKNTNFIKKVIALYNPDFIKLRHEKGRCTTGDWKRLWDHSATTEGSPPPHRPPGNCVVTGGKLQKTKKSTQKLNIYRRDNLKSKRKYTI